MSVNSFTNKFGAATTETNLAAEIRLHRDSLPMVAQQVKTKVSWSPQALLN